ncbi:MAG: DUF4129 domain-containing protein [Thermoplasmata archaeon]
MAAAAKTATPPNLGLWCVVLAVGLLVGAAAAFLTGSVVSGGGATTHTSQPIATYVGWGIIALGVAYLALMILDRARNGSMPVPTRMVVTILVTIGLVVAFIAAARVLSGAPAIPIITPTKGGNGTLLYNGTNTSSPNGTIVPPSGTFGAPPWAVYLLIAGALALVGLLATRLVLRRREEEPSYDADRQAVRAALSTAVEALEQESDPREVLVALYAQLLARLAPVADDLDTSTPEEIRRRHLIRLGVRASSAAEITRLFELARYSTHPILREDVERARATFREAIRDLDRRGAGAP